MPRAALSTLILPLLGACYSYTPISLSQAAPGSEVRARITGAASDRVGPMIGSLETRELIGNVVQQSANEIVLEVPRGVMPNVPNDLVPLHARVPLMPTDLVSFEQRKLDVGRTSLLAAAIAAGVGAGVSLALRSGGEGDPGKQPSEPPPIVRIPVWRVHF